MMQMNRILIADDDAHIRRVLSLWLSRYGYLVRATCDGLSTLEMLQTDPPDLLITDVNMPRMNGIELIREIDGRGIELKGIIVLTNRCDQAEIAALVKDTGTLIVPKPFSPRKLLELVNNLFAADAVGPADHDARPRRASVGEGSR